MTIIYFSFFLANVTIIIYFCNSMNKNIKCNSLQAWILAARPKTLSGAAVPVLIGTALAVSGSGVGETILIIPTIFCFVFAFIMQIDANFVNDYFDFIHGNDNETRLGPRRACAQGWISLKAMRIALCITTIIAGIVGLPLIYYGGLTMIIIGILCVAFCFLYTVKLSYYGLGDVLVLLFFGVIPVTLTCFLALPFGDKHISFETIIASISCGLVIDTLLVTNNYRDIYNDVKSGKRTLVVRIGPDASRILYLCLGVMACLLGAFYVPYGHKFAFLLPLLYLIPHVMTYKKMVKINKGKALNGVLGNTSRNMFLYGILVSLGFLL